MSVRKMLTDKRNNTFALSVLNKHIKENSANIITNSERIVPLVSSSVLANWTTALNLDSVPVLNFATVLYQGNGTTQDIVTGIDSVDFTVASNGSGYWLDRTVNQVKNDAGTPVASGTADWGGARGLSKVHIKSRSLDVSHAGYDGIRGAGALISTDDTKMESPSYTTIGLYSFNSNGFSVGAASTHNSNLSTYVAYQELFTHIKWGVTSHGKFYVEAYNPITGGGMIYYIGSGLVGHEIPHSQGVELDYWDTKNLSGISYWASIAGISDYLALQSDIASLPHSHSASLSYIMWNGDSPSYNSLDEEFITYYKRKTAQWTIVRYTGTGLAGNYVELGFKASRVIIKRLDAIGDWVLEDNHRLDQYLLLNDSQIEGASGQLTIQDNGIMLNGVDPNWNANGGQYILLAEADTNADGGGAYYPYPTTGLLNVNAGIFNSTSGLTEKGYALSSRVVTKSYDATGVTDGFHWLSENTDGTVSWFDSEPSYVWSETGVAYKDGSWYEDNVLMSPVPSFVPVSVSVAGGEVQYLGEDELATNVMPKTAFPDGIVLDRVEWGPRKPYDDDNTFGANPVAWIDANGVIYGRTDNGSYTKYPDGKLTMELYMAFIGTVTSGYTAGTTTNLPTIAVNSGVHQAVAVFGDQGCLATVVYKAYLAGDTTMTMGVINNTNVTQDYSYSRATVDARWK